ncbi:MAG: glutathione transferase [Gemmatimonadales bacterium]|nr:glutathione transferase [Gemmatimonadales bacterium]
MILYVDSQFASPYAMSAYVSLKLKRLPFEEVTVDLSAGQASGEDYRARSLTSRVPTLVDGDFSLSESSAISEYLEEKLPEPALYPRELHLRARARQVQAWIRSDLAALRQERPTEVVFYRSRKPPLSSAGAADAAKLLRVAGELVRPGKECICGDWCIADVDLALMLNRLVLNGDPVPDELERYARHQWEHAAIREWVGKPRPPLGDA